MYLAAWYMFMVAVFAMSYKRVFRAKTWKGATQKPAKWWLFRVFAWRLFAPPQESTPRLLFSSCKLCYHKIFFYLWFMYMFFKDFMNINQNNGKVLMKGRRSKPCGTVNYILYTSSLLFPYRLLRFQTYSGRATPTIWTSRRLAAIVTWPGWKNNSRTALLLKVGIIASFIWGCNFIRFFLFLFGWICGCYFKTTYNPWFQRTRKI